jgi:16S rRNA (cytosine1402-N4)-methyltransferase
MSVAPDFSHTPVLVKEVLELLSWSSPGLVVADLTVGGGGHLKALLLKNPRPVKILALDQDREALKAAKENLREFEPIQWEHGNFRYVLTRSATKFDRIFVDLGVSSHQLDSAERGFSFQKDGPLDMRMNPEEGSPISDWLMRCSIEELSDVLYVYGEESRARHFARSWGEVREKKQIDTTRDFVEALGFSLDSKDHRGRHPLTRVFQALRIQANDEFSALRDLLSELPNLLTTNGRVGILTFHSLEDREVKWALKGKLRPINKKVLQASREEAKENPRSRSAKLRVFEKN